MPLPSHTAAAHRDSKLLRVRKLSLWVTGGAAAVSLGLGTAFAHALPGHTHTTGATTGTTARPGAAAAPPAGGSRPAPAPRGHVSVRQHHEHQLARPTHAPAAAPAPAPAPAPPPVSSGGS
jgi:hypothetical protein